jgi:hypothetical protein
MDEYDIIILQGPNRQVIANLSTPIGIVPNRLPVKIETDTFTEPLDQYFFELWKPVRFQIKRPHEVKPIMIGVAKITNNPYEAVAFVNLTLTVTDYMKTHGNNTRIQKLFGTSER